MAMHKVTCKFVMLIQSLQPSTGGLCSFSFPLSYPKPQSKDSTTHSTGNAALRTKRGRQSARSATGTLMLWSLTRLSVCHAQQTGSMSARAV
eukprot:1147597-Pelagomonas_calceolata.AAC.7